MMGYPCVLGIDPGLTVLATAYADTPNLEAITLDTIRPGTKTGTPRLIYLRDRFDARLAEASPDLAVVEGYSYGSTNQSHQLGEIGGIIRVSCHDAGVPLVVVPPGKLKQWLTGAGNASKDRMMLAAQSRLGHYLTVSCHDEADALGLYWLGSAALGGETPLPDDDLRADLVDYVRAML